MRPRRVARIARWETARVGSIDRRTVATGLLVLVLVGGFVPLVATQGLALDRGIYRVGIAAEHPYHGAVSEDPTFAIRPPEADAFETGDLEVLFVGGEARYRDTPKGRAAVVALREGVEGYNDRQMRLEANQSAAFPVFPVTVEYVERNVTSVVGPSSDGGDGGSDGGDGQAGTDGAVDADGGTGGFSIPRPFAGGGPLAAGGEAGTPSGVSPPFPFQSLVLAFLFVLPLNFVIQAYGSSVLDERINRRGELLLVAPVTAGEIIAGKTAPYFLASLGLVTVVAVAVGGGFLSVLAMVPLVLLFLAATFLGALFARSFTELTFVTTTISVVLTAFAFVPAVFTDALPIALISPLTVAVRDLAGQPVSPLGLAFATIPSAVTAGVLFLFGAGIYREEDLFTQRAVHLKVLDALASRIRGVGSLVVVTALLVPFVFVVELLAVALLFAAPVASVPLLLAVVAIVEEVAKSLPVLAGYEHDRFDRSIPTAVTAGAAGGFGFFLGEKLVLVVQLVGLPRFRIGRAAFVDAGAGVGGPALAALLLAPLVLHAVTGGLSAVGASRNRDSYLVGLTGAVLVHLLYNLTVVSLYV